MRYGLPLLIIVFTATPCFAQVVEIVTVPPQSKRQAAQKEKVEVLGRGLVDYGLSEGQIGASAQVVKVHIGEPNGFSVPLYLMTGATSGDLGEAQLNKAMLFELINPAAGLMNVLLGGTYTVKRSKSSVTQWKASSAVSARMLTGRNATTGESNTSPALYADFGGRFQTGAWGEGDDYTDGVFWIEAKYAITAVADLESYFSSDEAPQGFRADAGLYIKDKVNIKLGSFFATKGKDLPTMKDAQVRLAFDYNVR